MQTRTSEVNRLQKVLEDANIKLASVATDVMGVSGRAMLNALRRPCPGNGGGGHSLRDQALQPRSVHLVARIGLDVKVALLTDERRPGR